MSQILRFYWGLLWLSSRRCRPKPLTHCWNTTFWKIRTCWYVPIRIIPLDNLPDQPSQANIHGWISLLKNELVILMHPGQRTCQIVDDYLLRQDVQLKNVIYISNLPAIMELESVGYGVSFVFESHLRHWQGGRSIDCYSFGKPRTTANFVAASRKGSYLPIYARDFIELVRRICNNQWCYKSAHLPSLSKGNGKLALLGFVWFLVCASYGNFINLVKPPLPSAWYIK